MNIFKISNFLWILCNNSKASLENTVLSIFDVVIGVYSFHMTVIKEDRQNPVIEFCRCDSHVWTFCLISERDCLKEKLDSFDLGLNRGRRERSSVFFEGWVCQSTWWEVLSPELLLGDVWQKGYLNQFWNAVLGWLVVNLSQLARAFCFSGSHWCTAAIHSCLRGNAAWWTLCKEKFEVWTLAFRLSQLQKLDVSSCKQLTPAPHVLTGQWQTVRWVIHASVTQVGEIPA